jgi:hypothetical protein
MINPQIAKLKEERDRLREQIDEYKREEDANQKANGAFFLVLAGFIFAISLWIILPLADLGLVTAISHAHPYNMAAATIFSLVYICAKVFVMVMALYAFLWGLLTIFDDEAERFGESARKWWAFHFGGEQPVPVPAVTPEEKLAATAARNGKSIKNSEGKK